jgi:hypothetical protein
VRVYVRHPSEFPVELQAARAAGARRERLHDLSEGGLCCRSHVEFSRGERVRIRIPVGAPDFEADGRVAWCRKDGEGYRVGVEFTGEADAFKARMVEQVCQIERYHRQQVATGRSVSEEDAAREWVDQYAARFRRSMR